MLALDHVTLRYEKDKNVLQDINIKIQNGMYVIVCGKSGSGKSTLLKAMTGLHRPNVGNIYFEDKDIYNDKAALEKFCLGYLQQESSLLKGLNVIENICLPAMLLKKNKNIQEIYHRGMELLGYVGMEEYAKQKPEKLSGGEKRRIELARILIHNPSYIILDEPTNNLDDLCVNDLMKLFEKLHLDGKTLIISTHDTRILQHKVDMILKIEENKVSVRNDS